MFLVRVAKDPEIRRGEILNAAIELFEEKGYDATAVSDIVKKVGVAQGTFYYHFKSKEEVLDAFLDDIIEEIEVKLTAVCDMELDAIGKVLYYFRVFNTAGIGRERMMVYLHEERNALLHMKLEKKIYPKVLPSFKKILEQGISEGVFDTEYPYEAAVAIFGASNAISEGKHDHAITEVTEDRRLLTTTDVMERILGAEKGIFIKYYKDKMEEQR
ncbi:MAG: TetR/AcrR family transcriptional regulator [Thermoplasmata archaeon]|nr:TetR/AcrR family transcriptional regulator [Thermoplasmata archaeon]